ncbi:MAG: polymer-forming cytoskeletal protein [Verrucomicrobia bacterium]|nr:MAG: polymer-forming cytoskeletal protein [Verrucomicrobiota bacterium]
MNPSSNSDSRNVLSADVEFKGTIRFSQELSFDGKLDGDIQSEGNLDLGENAVVKGTINVKSVVMRGKINATVTAKDKVDIKSKAELFGDIRAAKLVIEEGATFVGQSEINPGKIAATPPPAQRAGELARAV